MKRKKLLMSLLFLIVSISLAYFNYFIANSTKDVELIYVLLQDQKEGTKIEKHMIRQKQVGKYNLDSSAVTSLSQIEGKYLLQDAKKERILYTDLFTDNKNDLSFASRILGKAIAIKTDLVSSVAAEIKPDSIISLALITKNQDGSAIITYPEELSKVRVLKITLDSGTEINDEEKPESQQAVAEQKRPATLVLDLNDNQIEQLLNYNYAGNIHCMLLNEEIASKVREELGIESMQ